jgi:hypothetical protein
MGAALIWPALDATVIGNVNRLDLDDQSKSTPLNLSQFVARQI